MHTCILPPPPPTLSLPLPLPLSFAHSLFRSLARSLSLCPSPCTHTLTLSRVTPYQIFGLDEKGDRSGVPGYRRRQGPETVECGVCQLQEVARGHRPQSARRRRHRLRRLTRDGIIGMPLRTMVGVKEAAGIARGSKQPTSGDNSLARRGARHAGGEPAPHSDSRRILDLPTDFERLGLEYRGNEIE